jgi:predicted ferric reductase
MRLSPRALKLAIAGGALLPVALWLHSTPNGLHGSADWLTNAGRITGLLAGYGIVVQLLLMARVPILDRSLGTDRLARWHAFGGRYTISLVVAHTLLVIWGYALAAQTDVVGETGTLLTTYPDVMMATAALGLFLLVAAVSARAVRRRVRYETWYYLHFYTYLAIALAFAHAFANGQEFSLHQGARVLWAALYVGVAAVLVWHRFAVPVYRYRRHQIRVQQVRRLNDQTVSVVLTGRHLADLHAEAGQFFRWRFLNASGWWQSHPFSLSTAPRPTQMRITIKGLGDYTRTLDHLRPGTRVMAEGPYGALTAAARTQRQVLLLAGGVGITPLRALFATLPAGAGDLTLVYRVDRESDIVFRSELDEIARSRHARVHYLVGPPGSDGDVLVGDRLAQLVPGLVRHDVFVCGPTGFTEAAVATLRRVGVRDSFIHAEQFAF